MWEATRGLGRGTSRSTTAWGVLMFPRPSPALTDTADATLMAAASSSTPAVDGGHGGAGIAAVGVAAAATAAALPREVVDPHFHLWTTAMPNPNLGGIVDAIPHYKAGDYAADVATLPPPARLTAAVHVEAIVGQKYGGYKLDEVAETAFVVSQAEALPGVAMRVVPYANLAREDLPSVLDGHAAAAGSRLCGIRMILNYDAADETLCWPQVDGGDFLDPTTAKGAAFKAG